MRIVGWGSLPAEVFAKVTAQKGGTIRYIRFGPLVLCWWEKPQ